MLNLDPFVLSGNSVLQAAISAVVFHVSHMVLSVALKWLLVQRFSEVDGVCCTTSWLGFRKQVLSRTCSTPRAPSRGGDRKNCA